MSVRIKAYYNLSVKIWTVYRRRPPMNLRPEGIFLEIGTVASMIDRFFALHQCSLYICNSLDFLSVRVNPNLLRIEITGRKHLSMIWRHVARINRLDKPYLAECELRITNQLNLASSIQSSNCRSILEIPLLILWNPKFWRKRRNYSMIVFAYNKTFFSWL